MAHRNEELLRKGYAAFQQQDLDTLSQLFADDITWKVPGDTPLSGEFNGQQEVFGSFARIPELTDTFQMDIHDILANDEHSIGLVSMHVERGGRSLDGNAVHVYHIDDGRVTSAWLIQEDQAEWERFWSD